MSDPAEPSRTVAVTSRTGSPGASPREWSARPAHARPRRWGIPPAAIVAAAAVAALLPFLWDIVRVAAHAGGRVVFYGDEALEALATRDVWRGHQLLGPYSRFGWHHPGPALFYALAIPDRLLASTGTGMLIGILLLNAAAVAAVVLLVGRRAGPWAALWAAGCLALLHLAFGGLIWRQFWNPYAVILPMALLVVLGADAASGSVPSFCWALVAGTFAVQTHVSTAPAVAAILVVGLAALLVSRRRDASGRGHPLRFGLHRSRGGRAGRVAAVAGVVVTVVMWVPPLVDAARHHPSNVTLMWRFFTARHPTHTLGQAVRTSLTSALIVPLGRHGSLDAQYTRPAATLAGAAVVLLALAAGAIVIGHKRGRRFGPWLAVTSLVGFGAAVVGGTRTVGPIAEYLTMWQAFLPVTLLLALGASILDESAVPEPRSREAITRRVLVPVAAALAVCAALAGATVGADESAALASPSRYTGPPAGPEVVQATRMIRAAIQPRDRVVRLTMATDPAWPITAGVALELERDGYRTTVAGDTRDWGLLFGAGRRATGREDTDVEFYEPAPANVEGPPPRGRPLGSVGTIELYLNGT